MRKCQTILMAVGNLIQECYASCYHALFLSFMWQWSLGNQLLILCYIQCFQNFPQNCLYLPAITLVSSYIWPCTMNMKFASLGIKSVTVASYPSAACCCKQTLKTCILAVHTLVTIGTHFTRFSIVHRYFLEEHWWYYYSRNSPKTSSSDGELSNLYGLILTGITSVQSSSVAQLCLTLCDPMNRSTPGLPVHHQLPVSTQTRVRWVGDAIQPSYPLLPPSPPALNLSQHQYEKLNPFFKLG